jgi:hypothetical protein
LLLERPQSFFASACSMAALDVAMLAACSVAKLRAMRPAVGAATLQGIASDPAVGFGPARSGAAQAPVQDKMNQSGAVEG